jgi:RNA polymerase sigma-70 factor (ECF subfamily)
VYHKSVDWIRKAQKNRTLNEDDVKESLYGHHDVNNEEISQMMIHLNQLPIDQKMVLTLFYLQQHSVVEIAEILSIPMGTVKSRLFNARETLKKKLKQ